VHSADLFHVLSKYDARNLAALGVEGNKIRVIPHWIDINRFGKRRNDYSHDSVRIVWAGRIERAKGLMVLLKAVNLLRNEFQHLELLIGGRVWDPIYFGELINYKNGVNLEEAIFTGFVRDLSSFLHRADIFVFPSLTEVFGITILEAMAASLPVVASSVGAVPDIIADNYTGFLVPAGDSVELAHKLRPLIADSKLRRRMGRRGRERVESLFSVEKVFPSVLQMYHELF
jgi:glycosyltransferase involved in cell wall biosynthesis